MDPASVEQALSLNPPFAYNLLWLDDSTLRLTPRESLFRATQYTITINETARSVDGLPLESPIVVKSKTIGFLEVSEVVPAPGASGVETDSVVTVFFNRPVVPLTAGQDTQSLPHPLHFEPDIPGEGEWLNTSIYMWRPRDPLAGGQQYTVRVDGDLADPDGAVMPEAFSWEFNTLPPNISYVTPGDAQNSVPLDASIQIHFNQPMDQTTVEDAFTLIRLPDELGRYHDIERQSSQEVRGRFKWDNEGRSLTFTPSGLLETDAHYEARVETSARARNGEMTLAQGCDWRFKTVLYPAVKAVYPLANSEGSTPLWGGVHIAFTAPMDAETLEDKLVVDPPLPEDAVISYDRYHWRLNVAAVLEPSTEYTVTLLPGAADPYGSTIDRRYTFTFTTGPHPPQIQLSLNRRFNIFDVRQPIELLALIRNVKRANLQLIRLTPRQFVRFNESDGREALSEFRPSARQVARRWHIDTEARLNEAFYWRIPLVSDDGEALEPGIYLLVVSAPELEQDIRAFVILANAHLTYKFSYDESLVWLTDLQSGQPLSGVPVTFYDGDFRRVTQGETEDDGVLEVQTPHQANLNALHVAIAEGEGVFGLAINNWEPDVRLWQFGMYSSHRFENYSLYAYTDRPIYRPGQEVFFKAILRGKDDVVYSIPEPTDVIVTIRDNNYNVVREEIMTTSDFGTLDGSFKLDEEAATGSYSIGFSLGDLDGDGENDQMTSAWFHVAEYHKPEFQVEVIPAQDSALAGDALSVKVGARYFFGGPVSNAWVSWEVLSGTYAHAYEEPGRYSFYDYEDEQPIDGTAVPGYGRVIASGEDWLDENGQLTIDLPTALDEYHASQRFTVEVLVGSAGDQWVAGRATVVVHKGAYYVGIRPESYIGVAGEEQRADLVVVDWDNNPAPNQEVSVEIIRRQWYSIQEEDEDGRTHWLTSVEESPVGSPLSIVTDEDGKASFTFPLPEGGTYRIRATVADPEGNTTTSGAFMWATSDRYIPWARRSSHSIDLVTDKRVYRPGETARILIPSSYTGDNVRALVTVERGSILRHEVITLSSNSHVYELPITGELAPNAYVSVVLLKGVDHTIPVPEYKIGVAEIVVETTEQVLQVTVTPDRTQVGPGEEVTYTVETRDFAGRPVDAEVSLALVDLATLSLVQSSSRPIAEHFYREQSLGVRIAMSLIYLVEPLDEELLEKAKGGGGGGVEGFYDLRDEFKDTAYWEAALRTGSDGAARVTVRLPDNLTTWRMDVRAVTADTLVGQAEVDITVSKPLLIRPITPRFFVAGDESTLSAILHNNTGQNVDATVLLRAEGVTVEGEPEQAVTVPAGGYIRVDWPVTVDGDAERVDLVFSARGGGLRDSSKPPLGDPAHDRKLPVYRHEAPEIAGTSGQLDSGEGRVEHVVLPQAYESIQGQVDVRLDHSLAASMLDGLQWLSHYPYECTEQTVSRFLPNALTLRAFRESGLSDADLEANLEEQLGVGVQRLYAQQHADGGWGWFVDDESDLLVTAYVIHGLVAARESGFTVDEDVLERGVVYLQEQLQPLDCLCGHSSFDRQAYILYVLARAGQPDVSRSVQLYEARESIQYWARALLAQTLWMIEPDDPRLETIKSDLVNAAIVSATGVQWEEGGPDCLNWNTDTRSTAIILDTFALVWPDNELAPGITRWLMVARKAGHWETTQETVWALIGLTDWMTATRELKAEYDWSLSLNGQPLAAGHADQDTVQGSTLVTIDAADLLPGEMNHLDFKHGDGPGRLYYSAHLAAYLPVEEVKPLSRGMIVTRRYLDAQGKWVEEGHVGETLTVELTIIVPQALHYVVVEDFYPAGAEPVNTRLLTESVLGERPMLKATDPLAYGWGWWWFSRVELRDEKAILYADFLPSGTYQFTYQIRLGIAGEYHVIPPVAWEFYFPEVYARGEGMIFTVQTD